MGEAHRVARRYAQARLETAARRKRRDRDGGCLRPNQGGERTMIGRLLLAGTALTAACAAGTRGTPTAAAPALPPTPGPPPPPPPPEGPPPRRPAAVPSGPT